jgi:tetratricopeptide (TPR) repeat protein
LPDELVLKAAAEDVRLHIAAGNPQAGLDGLAQRRTAKPGQYADLDFAILEATASLWQQAEAANEKTKAEQFQKKSLELVQFIELHHGPYWGRRAELFLLGRVGKTASQDNLELLRRTADEFVRKEQLAEALLAYDRAAEMARQAQDADSAFQLAYKAALVQQRRGRIDDTIERLADLAARAPTHAQADQAHLLAVWLSAAEARKNPNQLDRYAELLSRHTHTWPDRATSDQARMWLGQLGESQSRWSDAVAAYRGVSKSTEHFEIAVERVAHSWKQWLAQLSRDNQPCEETARDAAEFLAKLCSDAMGNVPAELNATQRFAAITAAEILLQYTTDGYATAEQILSRALQHAATAPSQWTASANLLLVLALVGQPSKRDQAIDRLKSVGAGDPQELLRTLGKVAQLAEQAQAAQQQQLAAVQLEIARLLEPKRSALAPQQQLQLDVVRAKAHAAAGQRDAAVRLFEQIVAAQPDNGEFQERYAQLLLDAAEAASLNKALERWRIIARRSPPQSERWYAAKYSIALAQFKLGDKQGAAKLIRYLEATSGLGDEKTAKTFQELLSLCD